MLERWLGGGLGASPGRRGVQALQRGLRVLHHTALASPCGQLGLEVVVGRR
ncbi:MAG: hypothetical protein R3F59_33295 [Myxococcota bacterium]